MIAPCHYHMSKVYGDGQMDTFIEQDPQMNYIVLFSVQLVKNTTDQWILLLVYLRFNKRNFQI